MYSPFEDPARRRQQSQLPQTMPIQQPVPMFGQPGAPGPQMPQMPMQMAQMGEESGPGQQQSMDAAAGGIDSLLKRFQRPKAGELPGRATGAGQFWG